MRHDLNFEDGNIKNKILKTKVKKHTNFMGLKGQLPVKIGKRPISAAFGFQKAPYFLFCVNLYIKV